MRKQQHSIIPAFKLATDINVKWPPEEEGTRGRNESAIKCDLFVCHVLVAPHRCDVFICWHFSSPQLSQSFRPLNDMPRGLLSQSVSVSVFFSFFFFFFFFFFYVQIEKCTKNRLMKTYQLWWARTESSTGAQQLSEARFLVNGQLLFWGEVKIEKEKKKGGGLHGAFCWGEKGRWR